MALPGTTPGSPSPAPASADASSPGARAGVSIGQVHQQYPGQWIALRVSAVDERDAPLTGIVLAHGRSRAKISEAVRREWEIRPTSRISIFVAGTRRIRGEELRACLSDADALKGLRLNAWC